MANLALEPAIQMAKESGVAVVGVSRCGHTGTLSYYLRKIAEAGLAGMAMTQSDPMAVPFGGAEVYYGTNPIGFGAPSATDTPLIFDMATTVQAWGKILDARSKGREIPADWAVDENGQATTDPHAVRGLMPIAGPKGYGLMMMVDIFSGVLMNYRSENTSVPCTMTCMPAGTWDNSTLSSIQPASGMPILSDSTSAKRWRN